MAEATALRRALVMLAVIGVAGTAVELALERHWKTAVQLIPWYTLGAVAVAIVLLVARPGPRRVRLVRVIVALVFLSSAFGIFEHVRANYDAGELDFRYADRWATMSSTSRLWLAANGGVGPSPPLTPAVLAQSALCLGLATIRHPALEGGDQPEAEDVGIDALRSI